MLEIETGRAFALFFVPFGWRDARDDRKHSPVIRVRIGRRMYTLDGKGFRSMTLG